MIVGVPRETAAGERRVALVPELIAKVTRAGLDVVVEPGAGESAGFLDGVYKEKGARLEANALGQADIVLKVQPPSVAEVGQMKEGATLIGFLQPYSNADGMKALAGRSITGIAMELMPRITRAQSMDALSAMSTIAGYKAVLLGANRLPKFFPLLMTAAGTVTPAQVFILGAGVAGLQAIGTAKRLGAVVRAYDTRPVVREQVESLGAIFADLGLETKEAEAKTGYAKEQSAEFIAQQQERLSQFLAAADVVITTALVPGKKAPILITEAMVQRMQPGSVIIDLAAEQGGNCALTEPGQEVVRHNVILIAPLNVPSTMAFHASQMYARTVTNFLFHLFKDGKINLDLSDELTRGPLLTYQGAVVHEAFQQK